MSPAELLANYVSPFSVREGDVVRTLTMTELRIMGDFEEQQQLERFERGECCGAMVNGHCHSTKVRLHRLAMLTEEERSRSRCDICPKRNDSPAGLGDSAFSAAASFGDEIAEPAGVLTEGEVK